MSRENPQSNVSDERLVDALLEHLARYRLTVFAAVQRVPAFADVRPRRIHELLRLCRREGLIGSAPLHCGARYWYMETLGAERCGLSEMRTGPLSEAAKLRAYGMLRICCLTEEPKHRLTASELVRNFPTLHRPGLPCGYYFDPAGSGRLGLLRVDRASTGRWDRVVQSLRQDISVHAIHAGFRQLVAAGRFHITFITVMPQKAVRIRKALSQLRDTRRVPVEVASMPELLPLVTGSRRKEVSSRRTR